MKASEIQELTLVLRADEPYFVKLTAHGSTRHSPSLAERLQATMSNYQLGWDIARCFAEAKLPLPDFPWPTPVLRAYRFCSEARYCDETLSRAYELQQPEWWQERDLVRALLLSKDSTDQSIAEAVNFPPEVIADFEALWWNVRDRRGELLYRAQLRAGKHSEQARKLMRVACLTNNSDLILIAAERPTALSDKRLAQLIERLLVIEAGLGQELGFMSKKENPALALLEQHLVSSQEPAEYLDPATRISLDKSMQKVVQQMAQEHMQEIIEASTLALETSKEAEAMSKGLHTAGSTNP